MIDVDKYITDADAELARWRAANPGRASDAFYERLRGRLTFLCLAKTEHDLRFALRSTFKLVFDRQLLDADFLPSLRALAAELDSHQNRLT
jgi:hypothetical protein